MRRRELLRMIGWAGGFAGAILLGLIAPPAARLRALGGRSLRAPADLMARIRRRTRALDESRLAEEHDLAG